MYSDRGVSNYLKYRKRVVMEYRIVKAAREYWKARAALGQHDTDCNRQRIRAAKKQLYQALMDDANA